MTGTGSGPGDDEGRFSRPLLIALAALVGVSLLIGGVISLIALGAANLTVLDASDSPTSAKPSLYLPPLSEPSSTTPLKPNVTPSETETTSSDKPTERSKPPKPKKAISLQANPLKVAPGQQINLTGVYKQEGATLQVQRFQDGWTNFDATATVRGGLFETYIYTGVSGVNRLRMVDTASGEASNEVRVQVG